MDNKATKAGIGYTIGNILVKGISFLTLPLFSRLMTTEEFGVYNVFISYESILFVIIGLAIHTSMRSAKLEFPGKIDEFTSSVSLIYLVNLTFFGFVILFFGKQISSLINFSEAVLVMLVFYSFGSAVLTLYNHRISLDYAYKKYLIIALINTVGNIGLSLFLILTVFSQKRDIGRITGATVSLTALSVVLLLQFYKLARPKYSPAYWKFAIKYSLPIVPHGISQVLLAQFDRIAIRSMVGDAAAGIYSLAGNIKLVLTIITESISTAWTTWFYEEFHTGNREKIQDNAKKLCGLFCLFSVILIFISPELIHLLGGIEYIDGRYVAVPMIIDAFLLFVYNIVVTAEYYYKKTIFVMLGTIVAAVINLITNLIFIKKYGYIAAAYTTLFAYVIYLILHLTISRKLSGFFILPLKFLFIYSSLIILSAVLDLIFVEKLWLRLIFCACIAAPLAAWLAKISDISEIIKKKM